MSAAGRVTGRACSPTAALRSSGWTRPVASLDVARAKPGGQRVRWIHGDVTSLPALAVDLATMTGNVSNVFLTQQAWLTTLGGVHAALRPGGYLVFESVDPACEPWLNWNRETIYVRRESPDAGVFESWLEVTRVETATGEHPADLRFRG